MTDRFHAHHYPLRTCTSLTPVLAARQAGQANQQTIVRSWNLSGTSELEAPVSDKQIRTAEERLGKTLPAECVALYRLADLTVCEHLFE